MSYHHQRFSLIFRRFVRFRMVLGIPGWLRIIVWILLSCMGLRQGRIRLIMLLYLRLVLLDMRTVSLWFCRGILIWCVRKSQAAILTWVYRALRPAPMVRWYGLTAQLLALMMELQLHYWQCLHRIQLHTLRYRLCLRVMRRLECLAQETSTLLTLQQRDLSILILKVREYCM